MKENEILPLNLCPFSPLRFSPRSSQGKDGRGGTGRDPGGRLKRAGAGVAPLTAHARGAQPAAVDSAQGFSETVRGPVGPVLPDPGRSPGRRGPLSGPRARGCLRHRSKGAPVSCPTQVFSLESHSWTRRDFDRTKGSRRGQQVSPSVRVSSPRTPARPGSAGLWRLINNVLSQTSSPRHEESGGAAAAGRP